MARLYFSDPHKSRTCDKCGYFGTPRVAYQVPAYLGDGSPFAEWLDLTCKVCEYTCQMDVKA